MKGVRGATLGNGTLREGQRRKDRESHRKEVLKATGRNSARCGRATCLAFWHTHGHAREHVNTFTVETNSGTPKHRLRNKTKNQSFSVNLSTLYFFPHKHHPRSQQRGSHVADRHRLSPSLCSLFSVPRMLFSSVLSVPLPHSRPA